MTVPTWHQRLARSGYSTLLRVLQPVYLLKLYWRGRHEPDWTLNPVSRNPTTHPSPTGAATGRPSGT